MFNSTDRYLWLFDSTKMPNLKCQYALGNSKEGKYRFLYTYNDEYRYWIIEDAKLNKVTLNKIKDTTIDVSSNRVYIDPSEVNDMGWGGHIYFKSRLCIDSSNSLLLNIGKETKVERTNTSAQTSLIGAIKNVLIENENRENQYLLKYDEPKPTALIFYKPKDVLYMIVVNAFKGRKDLDIAIKNLVLN